MILACGIPSEPPVALLLAAVNDRGFDHVVMNQREAALHDIALEVGRDGIDGTLRIGTREVPLGDITGAYLRMMDVAALPESRGSRLGLQGSDALRRSDLLHSALQDWSETSAARIVNRASAMASNGSKPYQLQLIAAHGFATPSTLVTNDPDAARAFAASHGEVVYKSTSSVRSIVQRLTPERLREVARVSSLPTQFQAYVAGTDVRVHVVGERLFATEVVSAAVDYRYAGRDGLDVRMSPIELPQEVASRCISLAAALGLPFCGIDLRRDGDSYTCFEVNPSPAYSYYEQETGQPIAAALAQYLAAA